MAPRRPAQARLRAAVLLALALAGCHGGHRGGQLAPAAPAPYTAARPAYGPRPINPLYISGYAGRRPTAPPARVVVPLPATPAEPSLLP
jgi:hypothetical protein